MKFDYIIMNPPYNGNLHLKILEEAMKHSDNIVNLSPDDYRYNLGTYILWGPKLIENIFMHEVEYKNIPHREANDLFGLSNGIMGTLGVSYLKSSTKSPVNFWTKEKDLIPTLLKIRKDNLRRHFIRKEDLSENGQRIFRYHDDPILEKCYLCDEGKAVEGIDFSSKNEKDNFRKSISRWPYKLLFSIHDTNPAHAPYMGNEINPRTGLKGYEGEWLDEDFYKFFNLTEDEIKIIEEII